jgi:hypothetical protein
MQDFFKVIPVGDPATDTLVLTGQVTTAEGSYVIGNYSKPLVARSSYVMETFSSFFSIFFPISNEEFYIFALGTAMI